MENKNLAWRVHTPSLLNEVMTNNTTAILKIPIKILAQLLFKVGERAAEINDPELNALMCRLTIYAIANPEDKENYDPELTNEIINYKKPVKMKTEIEKKYFIEVEKALDWENGFLNYENKVVTNIEDAQIFDSIEDAAEVAASFNATYGRGGKIYARVY